MEGHPFLPETTQQEFYSETLTRLRAVKCQIKIFFEKRKKSRWKNS